MANEILVKQGTALVWTSSGGDYTLDMTSLANNAGRAGAKADLGATFPPRLLVIAEFDFNAAPTAGNTMNIGLAASHNNTDFDAEVSGSDSAFSSDDDFRRLHPVGALSVSNDTNPQQSSWVVYTPSRYIVPVVMNKSGQALTSTGTDQIITIVPLIDEVQDAP